MEQDQPTETTAAAETTGAADASAPEPERDEAEELRQRYLYAMADLDNTRKRLERRSEEAARASTRRLLLKILPILDNLERALTYEDSTEMRAGLDATLRGFEGVLRSEGVEPIAMEGTRFDPNLAEAIGTQAADGVEDETVVAQTRRGYRLGDELLRPAHVIVAKRD
jgi:molecular chaperone GrpE